MRSMPYQVAKTHGERKGDHPRAIIRQKHEAEIAAAPQRFRHLIRQAGRTVIVAEQALDHEPQSEREQKAVERIELAQMFEKKPLDHDAGRTDQNRRDHQRRPVIQPDILQQQIGRKGAHHVLGAVGEIDDVEHAENDGKAEAQQRIERAVDQAEQQLPEQRLRGNAENLEHGRYPPAPHIRASLPVPAAAGPARDF